MISILLEWRSLICEKPKLLVILLLYLLLNIAETKLIFNAYAASLILVDVVLFCILRRSVRPRGRGLFIS